MKIEVFKSEFTGELFEDEQLYKLHVEKYKAKEENDIDYLMSTTQVHAPRLTAVSLDDFAEKALGVINNLNVNYAKHLTLIKFKDFYFCDKLPSFYSGLIAFKDKGPKHGWTARIQISIAKDDLKIIELVSTLPGFHLFNGILKYSDKQKNIYEYEVQLYLEDFPCIHKQHDRYIEVRELNAKWETSIINKCKQKNKKDLTLVSYKKEKADYMKQMKALTKEIRLILAETGKLGKLIEKQENANNENVVLANPFNELKELHKLEYVFKK